LLDRPSLLGSVRIEQTTECDIKLGACCTSVYLDGVVNCTIQILSHQLRIHDCRGCKLYVRVQSHPIIEDCSDMGFAPYRYTYPGCAADIQVRYKYGANNAPNVDREVFARNLQAAGLEAAHHWNTVVDFRWHKSTHSPNWYEIPTADSAAAAAGSVPPLLEASEVNASQVTAETSTAPAPALAPAGAVQTQTQEDDDEF
jgi:hypothetical protein